MKKYPRFFEWRDPDGKLYTYKVSKRGVFPAYWSPAESKWNTSAYFKSESQLISEGGDPISRRRSDKIRNAGSVLLGVATPGPLV